MLLLNNLNVCPFQAIPFLCSCITPSSPVSVVCDTISLCSHLARTAAQHITLVKSVVQSNKGKISYSWFKQYLLSMNYKDNTVSWMKAFRIIPKFRTLRLTFNRKSASIPKLTIYNSVSDLFSDYLRLLSIFCWHTASFKI